MILFFIINAMAVYFVSTYGVIIDESMVGNILNTNSDEAGSFFSIKLIVYVVVLGMLPSIYISKVKIIRGTWKQFLITSSLILSFILILVFANAGNKIPGARYEFKKAGRNTGVQK